MDEAERRLKKIEAASDRAGRKTSKGGVGGFAAAAIGGAAGFVAGAVQQNEAVSSITDLVVTAIAVTLLPIIVPLLPLIQRLVEVLVPIAEGLGRLITLLMDAAGVTQNFIEEYVPRPITGVGDTAGDFFSGFPNNVVKFFTDDVPRAANEFLDIPLAAQPLRLNRDHLWGPDLVGTGP